MYYRKRLFVLALVTALVGIAFAGTAKAAGQSQPNRLSLQEAGTLAIWFISDNIRSNPRSEWSKDTRIAKITTLFDENENPSGYAFELQAGIQEKGYIVVAASPDIPFIQEWSYKGKPLFYHNSDEFDRVYYTGPLEYLTRYNGHLFNSDKNVVAAGKRASHFPRIDEAAQHNAEVLAHIHGKGLLDLSTWMLGYNGQVPGESGYGGIYDAYAYVNDRYGSGWTLQHAMYLGVPAYLQSSFEANANNCTLSALTMVFEYWRAAGKSSIPSNPQTLYDDIRTIAVTYGYTPTGGTPPTQVANIAAAVWSKYGYSGTSMNVYVWSYSSFTSEVDAGRPAVININSGYYANHSVALRGYETYSKSLNPDKGFLWVNDNWTTETRYIDYAVFNTSTLASITTITP